MPGFPWLEERTLDAEGTPAEMIALRRLGTPYTQEQIDGARAEVEGKTEMDALIAYLQGLGKALRNKSN